MYLSNVNVKVIIAISLSTLKTKVCGLRNRDECFNGSIAMSLSKSMTKVWGLQNREEGRYRIIAGWKDKRRDCVAKPRRGQRSHHRRLKRRRGDCFAKPRGEQRSQGFHSFAERIESEVKPLRAQKEGFCEEGRDRKGFAVSRKEFKVNLNRLRQSAECILYF